MADRTPELGSLVRKGLSKDPRQRPRLLRFWKGWVARARSSPLAQPRWHLECLHHRYPFRLARHDLAATCPHRRARPGRVIAWHGCPSPFSSETARDGSCAGCGCSAPRGIGSRNREGCHAVAGAGSIGWGCRTSATIEFSASVQRFVTVEHDPGSERAFCFGCFGHASSPGGWDHRQCRQGCGWNTGGECVLAVRSVGTVRDDAPGRHTVDCTDRRHGGLGCFGDHHRQHRGGAVRVHHCGWTHLWRCTGAHDCHRGRHAANGVRPANR